MLNGFIPMWVYVYDLCFKMNSFFQGAVRRQCFPSYLCKELISKTVSSLFNCFLLTRGAGALKLNYYNISSSEEAL